MVRRWALSLLDEFANVSLPDDFEKILSVMRSRNVSVSIIIQNIAQLKALFEKQYESLIGNCDSFLYLGGNEQSTHKMVSELLGKATIDTNTYGRSRGSHGNYTTNWQLSGRDLLTADEVRMLDNRYALLFVRGERPIQDEKYNLASHPRIKQTADGGHLPYRHGVAGRDAVTVTVQEAISVPQQPKPTSLPRPIKPDFDVLTEEELWADLHPTNQEKESAS